MKQRLGHGTLEPLPPEKLAAYAGVPNDHFPGAYGKYVSRVITGVESTSSILLTQRLLIHKQLKDKVALHHSGGMCRLVIDDGKEQSRHIPLKGIEPETVCWVLAVLDEIDMRNDPARQDDWEEYRRRCGVADGSKEGILS